MIYFIQNTKCGAIKIGYTNNAKKRLVGLQTATPDPLVLLGTVYGGIDVEADFHRRFANYALTGEWFKGEILGEVQQIIAKEAANPPPAKTNVIVYGDTDQNFVFCGDPHRMAAKAKLQVAVFQALDEINAKTPIDWIITGGNRQHDVFAWEWANQHKVQLQRFEPNWGKYGRVAAFKVGPKMLRSQFSPKLLLVILTGDKATSATSLIRQAQKAKIETVVKRVM